MPIPATSPTALEASFDLWAYEFSTIGDGLFPFGTPAHALGATVTPPPIRALARLIKYRLRPDGIPERSPLPSDTIVVSIADLYAAAASDADVAAALVANQAVVAKLAAAQGKL